MEEKSMKRFCLYVLIPLVLIVSACIPTAVAPEPTPVPPTPTEPEVYYSLVVNADPPEGGIVVPTSEILLAGSVVHVEAKPGVGYEFTGWSGSSALTSPGLDLTMDGDKALTAHFHQLATNTPLPPTLTPTPENTPIPEIEPTSENPWILQKSCETQTGCVVYEVRNKTDDWLQVSLTNTATGDSGFFSVAKRTTGYITLKPGQYQAQYTWWCKGKAGGMTVTWAAGLWIDIFECPEGYKGSIKK
jgi:uncharacterized repeat protein (TIGR02543 family)